MVNTVGLAASCADLDIVRETCLGMISITPKKYRIFSYPHSRVKSSGDVIVLLKSRATT
jgi:hypothetical protein